MSRSNRKIKTLFKLWTWLKGDTTMDAVLRSKDANEIGVIPTTRWVPLRNEEGEVQMYTPVWSDNEYPVKIQQDIPEHELKANLAQYIQGLQRVPASIRDEWGQSLVKKAKRESKAAGKREIAQQLWEMQEDTWQKEEDEAWEALYVEVGKRPPLKSFFWNERAKALIRIEKEIAKSWEDKVFYDKHPSHRYDFWERCDPDAGCSFCGCDDWENDWDGYTQERYWAERYDYYDDDYEDYERYYPFHSREDADRFHYEAPTLNEMWEEEEEINRCNRFMDRMDLAIDMMHWEAELEEFDSDWNNFFPGHKEPLEDDEKRRLVHAERRRRTYTPR